MTTVIIAAHNEEAVIGACLTALAAASNAPVEVIVSANGCNDATVAIARAHGAVVIDRPEPGKAGALNAAEDAAPSFPRIYLDADIIVPAGAIDRILDRLEGQVRPLAVVPRRRVDTADRPWAVRSYFAINERLPAFQNGLFGRGMIAVSEAGRERFAAFPLMIADDLFLDSQFADAEKAQADDVEVVVEAPRTTRALRARLVRVRRGNSQMRGAAERGEVEVSVRPSDRWAWLRVALRHPRLIPAGIAYALITIDASRRARDAVGADGGWGRDDSTRDSVQRAASVDGGPRASGFTREGS